MKSNEEKERLSEWVKNWQETGKELEKLRIKEIRESVITKAIPAFDGVFRSAILLSPLKPTSGLIQLQDLLKKLRK